MKKVKLPIEVWKCLEVYGRDRDTVFNQTVQQSISDERMPEEWRRSVLIPIYKNKENTQCCGSYRGIKMSDTIKIWKRIVELRLRDSEKMNKQQYEFIPEKGTTDAMFSFRMLIEKYREGQRELHCVFVDLEKASTGFREKSYDTV